MTFGVRLRSITLLVASCLGYATLYNGLLQDIDELNASEKEMALEGCLVLSPGLYTSARAHGSRSPIILGPSMHWGFDESGHSVFIFTWYPSFCRGAGGNRKDLRVVVFVEGRHIPD